MRGIDPTELTKQFRGSDKSINNLTYLHANAEKAWRMYWLNPMLNCFDGIVMQDLVKILIWSNKNIFTCIDTISLKTTNVHIRIVTGMLNKITYLTEQQKQQLHLNLIQSIKWLQTEYIVADLRNSPNDLPF